MKLRILILADPFTQPSFAPRLRYLCRYLQQQGHRPEVYTERWDPIPFEHEYPIHEIALMQGGMWALKSALNLLTDWKSRVFTRRVRQAIAGRKYDMVFCTTFSTFPLRTAYTIARERNIPFIADIRDLDEQVPGAQYQHHRQWYLRPFRAWYRAVNIRRRNRVLRAADVITTISPWHVAFLRALNPRVELIYNGYHPGQFYPEDIPTDTFRVCYIGRLYEFQSIEPVRQAVSELNRPDIRLELHTPAQDPLPLSAVGDTIRRASVMVVLTNKQAKGMMTTKFYEALGCEKPILCYPDDEGELARTIRATNAGLATDDIEAMKTFILEKYREWKQLGFTRQAVRDKELFNRERQAAQFEDLFCHSTRV